MAQAMLNKNYESAMSQTDELMFILDKTKLIRVYWSDFYKDYVLCFHFSNNKRFIFTKPMWEKFKTQFANIENGLNRSRTFPV